MVAKYRHNDPQVWLDWLATIGKWPEPVRELGEQYPGCTCYHLPHGEHVWIQAYDWEIPTDGSGTPKLWVTVLQGKDSRFPGIAHSKVPVQRLRLCGCDRWMPPTKEQGERSQAKYLEYTAQQSRQAVRN